MTAFKLGDRVRLNPDGRRSVTWKKTTERSGTVVRLMTNTEYVTVLWDEKHSIDVMPIYYLEGLRRG